MEITLHLVSLQTTIDTTRVRRFAPTHRGTLGELPSRVPPHLTQHMMRMGISLLLRQSIFLLVTQRLVLMLVLIPLLHPQVPARFLALQQVAS